MQNEAIERENVGKLIVVARFKFFSDQFLFDHNEIENAFILLWTGIAFHCFNVSPFDYAHRRLLFFYIRVFVRKLFAEHLQDKRVGVTSWMVQ